MCSILQNIMTMKHLQIFSKYLIYISIIGVPLIWVCALYFDFFYSPQYFLWQSFISFMYHLSWLALLFVMSIRPLSQIFPKIRILKQMIFLRKAFWILSASIIVSNLVWWMFTRPDFFLSYLSLAKWEIGYALLARISEITAVILLVTSNNYSIKKLKKNWKRVQYLAYPYFISWGLVAAQFEPIWYYGSMGTVASLYIIVIAKKMFSPQ